MSGGARGLFIDLDGTLADSLHVMRAVYERFLAHHGRVGSRAEFDSLNGPPLDEIVRHLARVHGLGLPHGRLMALYTRMIDEAYGAVRPCAGAPDLLAAVRARGMKVAVVTSSSSALAGRWLRRVGLDALIDAVVGGDEVTRGKPDPEPYRLAMARCGCSAEGSLAVEDSPTGCRAALAAGLKTFFVLPEGEGASPPPGAIPVGGLAELGGRLAGAAPDVGVDVRDVDIWELDEDFQLVMVPAPPPPPVAAQRVDELWAARILADPALFDGPVLGLVRHDRRRLEVAEMRYRHVLARRAEPGLGALGLDVRPLAVTAVLLCPQGVVLGRRNSSVAADAGVWEALPAGGLSQPDPRAQVIEELSEELGLGAEAVGRLRVRGLVADRASGVVDMVFLLETPLAFAAIKAAWRNGGRREHRELAAVPLEGLDGFLERQGENTLPALKGMLSIALAEYPKAG
jgi:HAD superfamily hydrolase (TIGR01509 family)